ncbi:alpha/beta hydrolase [Actinophytocola sediminis]
MAKNIASGRLLSALCVLPLLAVLGGTSAAEATEEISCTNVTLPVASVVDGPADVAVSATLCRPTWQTPTTVQLLVHGGTYTRAFWDWPQQPDTYSYMRAAVRAGYATLAVDRIGHGTSTRPPSAEVTIPRGNTALHGVVTHLRAGIVGGIPFQRVVWVGHSIGAVHGYEYGGRFDDVDAYVFTGSAHFMKPSFLGLMTNNLVPPGADAGYLTTVPGSRDDLFYRAAVADPAVIAQDESLKDTLTNGEVVSGLALLNVAPAQSPTQRIDEPVSVFMGEFDNLVCGGPDGITCTKAAVEAMEAPYFTNAARLDVATISGAGHAHLHLNAPALYSAMLNWTRTVAPPV